MLYSKPLEIKAQAKSFDHHAKTNQVRGIQAGCLFWVIAC